jgi:hypothetical protein
VTIIVEREMLESVVRIDVVARIYGDLQHFYRVLAHFFFLL